MTNAFPFSYISAPTVSEFTSVTGLMKDRYFPISPSLKKSFLPWRERRGMLLYLPFLLIVPIYLKYVEYLG